MFGGITVCPKVIIDEKKIFGMQMCLSLGIENKTKKNLQNFKETVYTFVVMSSSFVLKSFCGHKSNKIHILKKEKKKCFWKLLKEVLMC